MCRVLCAQILSEKNIHPSNNEETEASSCHIRRQHFKTTKIVTLINISNIIDTTQSYPCNNSKNGESKIIITFYQKNQLFE